MKKRIVITFVICLVFLFGCSKKQAIPDITETDEESAKIILANKGMIPVSTYEYSYIYDNGKVMGTIPEIGTLVEADTKVTIIVSKGPERIKAKDGTISWHNITSAEDEWNLYEFYITNETLYISCSCKFGFAGSWKNWSLNYGFGQATVSDMYDKKVPIKIYSEIEKWEKSDDVEMTIEIPVNDLDVTKTTNLTCDLIGIRNGVEQQIELEFSIAW